jgi:uncharacterized protein YfiM (DUF2279 family)
MNTAAKPGRLSGMGKRLRHASLAVLALAWLAPRANADVFRLFPSTVPASYFFAPPEEAAPGFRLADLLRWRPWSGADSERFRIRVDLVLVEAAAPDLSALPPLPPLTEPPLLNKPTLLTTGVTLVGAGLYGLSAGWAHGFNNYHWGDEGWFGLNSYGGGSDKASHFIVCTALARELAWVYDRQGHTEAESTALAFGITTLSGLIVEVVDGYTPYGFGWQDLTMDVLGAATGLLLTRNGLDDLIGFRLGKVPSGIPDGELDEREPFLGTAYSTEVYSADLKIAGLSRRMRFDPGPARFLMTSVTYSTKGYGYVPPVPERQRLIGFELGLNVPEILLAVGVRETTWWGTFLLKAFNFFRIPFTSFGFRYDLNSHTWHGPDTGNIFY